MMDAKQKIAFWETLARMGGGLARGAGNFGKGLLGMGALSSAGKAGKAMNMAGKATGVIAPVAGAMSAGQGASFMGFGGAPKTGSLALDRVAVKVARLGASDLVDIASYGSFIGAKLTDPHTHPRLHAALDAAGLLGLGATTAHSLATNPADRAPSAKDLVGLALMGSALYDRAKAHGH
jgi:hypothetical protein